jgi:paraquat-inducible protein B
MVSVWAVDRARERAFEYVSVFEASASGIKVGNDVTFRGVKVGEVTGIALTSLEDPAAAETVVTYALDARTVRALGAKEPPRPQVIAQAVSRGLRARLGAPGLLGGSRSVSLEYVAGAPPAVMRSLEPGGPLAIPTAPAGEGGADGGALQDVMRQLAEADLGSMVDSITALSDQARVTLKQLQATLRGARAVLGPDAPVVVELRRTLVNANKTLKSIEELTDYLQRNPSALIRGRANSGGS